MPAKRLRQDVLPLLLRRIIDGELKPGARIVESRLAAELAVSRTPLREALLALEREGLVRSDRRRGFTIETLSAGDVRETYPLLAALESFAVRSSAPLLPLVVPELKKINARLATTRSPQKSLQLDTRFHETLTSQCTSVRLLALIESLRLVIRRYEQVYMSMSELLPTSVAQHAQIIGAIERGDEAALFKAIEQNYSFGMHVLLRQFEKRK